MCSGTINTCLGANWCQFWLQLVPWPRDTRHQCLVPCVSLHLWLWGQAGSCLRSRAWGLQDAPCHAEPIPHHLPPVALNFQTAGMEMDLCDGLFSQNGHCGYVLKPAFMRDEGTLFNPSDPSTWQGPGPVTLTIQVWAEEGCWGSCVSVTGALPVPAGQRAILHVPSAQVISGQQLPKVANSKDGAIIDPLVRVEIHGVPADQAHQETKYIENNGEPVVRGPAVPVPALSPTSACSPLPGFNPHWDETLQFQLHMPQLALVRFVVEDYDKTSRNDFVGQFTLAFANIKPGERLLRLRRELLGGSVRC